MLPLPLILALVLAGLVVIIIFLIFHHLGKQEKDLDKHTLQLGSLKNEITQKDGEVRDVTLAKDKLQGEIGLAQGELNKLKEEFAAKDKIHQQLKVKYEQLEKKVAEKEDLQGQMEQQKKQFTEQVIKHKKLEKDLHAKQDEMTVLEQRNKKLTQDLGLLRKELTQAKAGLQQEKQDQEQAAEQVKPEPEQAKETAAPEEPKEETKTEQSKTIFNRFLKPKISEDRQEEPPPGGHKPEQPKEPSR